MDGTVALFDAASGKLLHTLDGHFKPVRDLCFTPGGFLSKPSVHGARHGPLVTFVAHCTDR